MRTVLPLTHVRGSYEKVAEQGSMDAREQEGSKRNVYDASVVEEESIVHYCSHYRVQNSIRTSVLFLSNLSNVRRSPKGHDLSFFFFYEGVCVCQGCAVPD